MQERETKEIANGILLAVIKEFRLPIWAALGFCLAQVVGFFAIGVTDHFKLQNVEQTQHDYVVPKVTELWDEHWKQKP